MALPRLGCIGWRSALPDPYPENNLYVGVDNIAACVYSTHMKNTEATIEALKGMTVEERIAFLQATRPELFQAKAPVVSFGKAPKSGWTDADRIAK